MENSGLGQLLDVERAPGCQTCRPGNVCHCPGAQTSILGLRGARAPGPKAAFWVSLLWAAFRASGSSWMSNVQAGKRVALPWVSDEHCRPQSSFSCWPQGSILGLGLLLDVKRAGRETCATDRGLGLAFWASEELELLAPRQHSGSRCSGPQAAPNWASGGSKLAG